MMPVAFMKGVDDYAKGISALDCPYIFGTKEADQWLAGWNEAMNDYYGVYTDDVEDSDCG